MKAKLSLYPTLSVMTELSLGWSVALVLARQGTATKNLEKSLRSSEPSHGATFDLQVRLLIFGCVPI